MCRLQATNSAPVVGAVMDLVVEGFEVVSAGVGCDQARSFGVLASMMHGSWYVVVVVRGATSVEWFVASIRVFIVVMIVIVVCVCVCVCVCE